MALHKEGWDTTYEENKNIRIIMRRPFSFLGLV